MSTNRRTRRLMVTGALTLAVSLTAGCGNGSEDPTSEPPPADDPTTSQEAPSEEPTSQDPTTDDADDEPSDWQEVDFGSGTFMVPPTWEVETYEAHGEERERALHGLGSCPSDDQSVTGLAFDSWVPDELDAVAAMESEANRMASSAFSDRSPEIEYSDIEEGGGWVSTVAAVSLEPSDEPCAPVEVVFMLKAVPIPDESGTFVFVVLGEMGLEESPSLDELVEISNSMRT